MSYFGTCRACSEQKCRSWCPGEMEERQKIAALRNAGCTCMWPALSSTDLRCKICNTVGES